MNANQLFSQVFVASALALAGGAAMADDVTVVADTFVSTKTRAEVKAEVLQARADGVLQFATETQTYVQPVMAAAQSTLTRAEVRAELLSGPRVSMATLYPGA